MTTPTKTATAARTVAQEVIECFDWPEAFDICRERQRPIVAKVGNEIGKCFPSGRFEFKAFQATKAEGSVQS
jgi:hypothetical protein